jgi:hypothetical protein
LVTGIKERTKAAIERLLAQQRLDGTSDLEVRLSPQNQVYLNTWRPTRAAIPASLLEKMVPGFRRGVPCMLKVTYLEKSVSTYHRYVGGDVWIPTTPDGIGRPDEILHIQMELFGIKDFFSRYPGLMLVNDSLIPNMTDQAVVEVSCKGRELTLAIQQLSPIEEAWEFQLKGRLIGDLVFQTGSVFVKFQVMDSFGVGRRMRLYHNGYTRAGLAVNVDKKDFFRVSHVSYDGFRVRLAYSYSKGIATTSMYLKAPNSLYRIGNMEEISLEIPVKGVRKVFRVDRVELLRDCEKWLVSSRRHYEIGRVGAEIAYSIAREKFGCDDLVIEEPAKGGKDIHSRDSRIAVEARLLSRVHPALLRFEISRQMERMTHRLRKDFWYTPAAVVGYAILSYVEFGEIRSVIAQIIP